MALTGQNLEPDNFNSLAVSSGGGSGSVTHAGAEQVLRFDRGKVQDHIKNIIMGGANERNTFLGLEKLKKAASKKIIREGQIIFGTVSLAHHLDVDDSFMGWITNMISPVLLGLSTGQPRNCAYLHAAVYAGTFEGQQYLVENGGGDPETREGEISAVPIDEAFETDSNFFVVSPPKDSANRSTRHLVLQRALACLGVSYIYNMKAVSCETFVTALFGALEPKNFELIQMEIIKPKKGKQTSRNTSQQTIEKFEKFYQDLIERINKVPKDGILLSLSYYLKLKDDDKAAEPWFSGMEEDYAKFFNAAASGGTEACITLLRRGLNPNATSSGSTAVEDALQAGNSETALALIDEGADDTNALILSAQYGVSSAVKALIASGSNINKRDKDGCTALIKSAQNGFTDIVTALIMAGADLDIPDKYGDTGLIKAAQKDNMKIISNLIKSGAKIEHTNFTGYTALLMASRYGHSSSVAALIMQHANIEHRDKDENTALLLASKNAHQNTVCELINAKADVNHVNSYPSSALIMAAEAGSEGIVRALLAAGADTSRQDQYGCTAQDMARENSHISIVKAIEEARRNVSY